MEDLVKLMVERWYLPEDLVRKFLSDFFPENTALSLDQIREITADLLQDVILGSAEDAYSEKESPTV